MDSIAILNLHLTYVEINKNLSNGKDQSILIKKESMLIFLEQNLNGK